MSAGGGHGGSTQVSGSLPVAGVEPAEVRALWARIGRYAGYLAGAAILTQSVLFLIDTTGLIEAQVGYQVTSGGLQNDLAAFYVAVNERQHRLWWNVAIRDTAGPIAYLAVMVLVLAVRSVLGRGHPRADLAVLFTVIGASAAAVSDLVYLSPIRQWKGGGFQPTPDIVASGRASELIGFVDSYLQYAGFVVLALAFLCLAAVFRGASPALRRVSRLAFLEACVLCAFVLSDLTGWDLGGSLGALGAGVLVGPAAVVLAGRALR